VERKDKMLLLEARHLKKSFGNLAVLTNINLQVREGELKSIIGPNGAGKTTLFNVITGRIPLDSGQILFRGKDVTRAKPHVFSRLGMARSFQINNFFPNLTTLENVELAVQSRLKHGTSSWRRFAGDNGVEEKALEILESTGLQEHRSELAMNLSYGDQRKLEIGLALGTEPQLLLLDEPTSGMSRFESRSMIDLIENLSKRVTIILIEHDIELVMRVSDSVLVIHYGQKIAEGAPEEIEKNEEVQHVYLGGL
jgi:branched-chain amino acid transport system ATP-binding protein